MTTTNEDAEIDQLLDSTWVYGVDWTEHREKQESGDHDVGVYATKIKEEMKQKLKAVLTHYIARKTVERAIEELTKIQYYWYAQANGILSPKPDPTDDWVGADIYDRIAELESELHKLDGEQE